MTAGFQQYATYWPPMILAFEILENSTKQAKILHYIRQSHLIKT